MKKETFENGIGILFECFPHKSMSMDIAWDLLKDLEDRRFMVAIKDICSATADIYPNTNFIALIREIALSGKNLLSGEAWGEVMKEIGRTGHAGKPRFSDDVTAKVVEAIGWRNICLSENIGVERAHFMKIYDTMEQRTRQDRVRLPEVKALLDETIKTIEQRGDHAKMSQM